MEPSERFNAARFRCRMSFSESSPRLLMWPPPIVSESGEMSLLPSGGRRAVSSRQAVRSFVSLLTVLLSEPSIDAIRLRWSPTPPPAIFLISSELLGEDFFMHRFSGPSATGGDSDGGTGAVSAWRSSSCSSSPALPPFEEDVLRGLNLCNERDRLSSLLVVVSAAVVVVVVVVVGGLVVRLLEDCVRIGEVHGSTLALGRLIDGSANTCGGSNSFGVLEDIRPVAAVG
uniref:Uncharacterized protein n=1 Tax=Anopheles maculatus TaxID=74869 RepID=A0A182SIV9_9DIPT